MIAWDVDRRRRLLYPINLPASVKTLSSLRFSTRLSRTSHLAEISVFTAFSWESRAVASAVLQCLLAFALNARAGACRRARLHRVLLQPDAPEFDARLSQSRTVQASSKS